MSSRGTKTGDRRFWTATIATVVCETLQSFKDSQHYCFFARASESRLNCFVIHVCLLEACDSAFPVSDSWMKDRDPAEQRRVYHKCFALRDSHEEMRCSLNQGALHCTGRLPIPFWTRSACLTNSYQIVTAASNEGAVARALANGVNFGQSVQQRKSTWSLALFEPFMMLNPIIDG